MKQFIIRYANWKIDEIQKRETTEHEKHLALRKVYNATFHAELQDAPIDEIMKAIAEA